ncbi:MAG: FAD-binding oxidoreductase [Burkholderiaceae bacterium]|nr:FAD-binding oxidoreductase [Burkholderiaceae bacterium]
MTAQFLSEVQAALGSAAIKTAPADIEHHAIDWRKRFFGKPLAVIFPANTEQVAQVVRLANQHKVALVPQGGNTGLSGGATPDASGTQAILSLTRLTRVRHQDAANKTITVEAGVSLQRVQELAEEMGLLFPLSLGAEGSATIGGNLATNAGGTGVLRYGNARDLCLGVEVVTPSGEIWNGLRALRKDNTGYDLRDLFIGSEGTLGLITAAVLKLYPRPKGVMTALVKIAGPEDAFRLLQIAQSRCDAALTAFEYMSAESTQVVIDHFPEVARHGAQIIGGMTTDASPAAASGKTSARSDCVLMEISHAESERAATALLESVIGSALEEGVVLDAIVAQTLAQTKALWHLRETITLGAAEDGAQVKLDIALPISALVDFIDQMNTEMLSAFPGVRLHNFGHFGDGNLHYNIGAPRYLAAGKSPEERRKIYLGYVEENEQAIRRLVHDRVVAMNGSISAEHGLGQLRKNEARRYKTAIEFELMSKIKLALDPNGILNPGKVL